MKKTRYVLIGFGGIAENRVAKEGFACDKRRFKPLKNAVLVGAMDLNPARQKAAEALGLKWYGDLKSVLADKSVDGVYVATNNRSHVPLAMEALKAGKHVIVEKPIATSIADAKKLNKLAKAKKLSLTVDHMMVNNAWNIAGKAAMKAGSEPWKDSLTNSCEQAESYSSRLTSTVTVPFSLRNSPRSQSLRRTV